MEENILHSFRRYEKKFILTAAQYDAVLPAVEERMRPDEYGAYTICSVYFDTDNYDLIRTSLDRPVYKEKFRLRSYGVPRDDGIMFAELKKNYDGVVYKRRVEASPREIHEFILEGAPLSDDPQIQNEIRWFLRMYRPKPKVFIAYERRALVGVEDGEMRVTFDRGLRYRRESLDLRAGDRGDPILDDDLVIMEVKTPAAIPLWMTALLSAHRIYTTPFSKYGTCYRKFLLGSVYDSTGGINHA